MCTLWENSQWNPIRVDISVLKSWDSKTNTCLHLKGRLILYLNPTFKTQKQNLSPKLKKHFYRSIFKNSNTKTTQFLRTQNICFSGFFFSNTHLSLSLSLHIFIFISLLPLPSISLFSLSVSQISNRIGSNVFFYFC